MNFDLKKIIYFAFFFTLAAGLSSCVDQEFTEPPTDGTPLDVEANTTVAELKALYVPGKLTKIEDDIVIRGVVVADDRSGNFFRSLIFQDESAGIEVLINLTDYYNFYPIGRELAIDCQGLYLGEYNGVVQLGGYTYIEGGSEQLGDIVDFNQRISRGMLIGTPEPAVRTINSLGTQDISTLVKLENVEFAFSEVGLTYADAFGRQTLNRTIQDCDGNTIVLRTSGFANFAGDTIPEGNGTLVAIYNVFGSTRQLYIRTLDDLQMNKRRCSGATGQEQLITIAELRDIFNNGGTAGPADKKVQGVVISEKDNGNFDRRNIVIQDATAGIVVRFSIDHGFGLGEEVEIIVSGQKLSEYNGLLELDEVDNELAVSKGFGQLPIPRQVTIKEILDNAESWESTLVKVSGAFFSDGGTFSGEQLLMDATGQIDVFTRSTAAFASAALPVGELSIVSIVSQSGDTELKMRKLTDIESEGQPNPDEASLAEIRALFNSGTTLISEAKKVRGMVISDKDNGNTPVRNIVLQDNNGGIVVRFLDPHDFALGEEVEVNVTGQMLSDYNGLLQILDVPNANAISFGPASSPVTPRVATIEEVLANSDAWESTLIKINDVVFLDSGTFSGAHVVNDGTGEISIYTGSGASFADEPLPSNEVNITGITSEFNGAVELKPRNASDIGG
ncbi:MAG: hypothetical protein J5I94_18335 [Phaeodactylibacter sp.]|nr:hypothetical protein [Phaeodactylibacter sp.]